ncbi:Hypothetical_protein [Hexamita inflata]|uniref:Hypothetical_protein n=1 Tax=Hexamita inflata TaxID=28002 RepID=A0AA86R8L7_9EUKA|nr:Hypothetical protein HINF_LOCUS60395 [Hexamita inflata]
MPTQISNIILIKTQKYFWRFDETPQFICKSSQYKRRHIRVASYFVFSSTSLQSWQEQQPAGPKKKPPCCSSWWTSTTITSSWWQASFHPGLTAKLKVNILMCCEKIILQIKQYQ